MTVLSVPDMHCAKCVERITNALNRDGLVFQVNLEQKTVTVEGAAEQLKTAVETLDDLGFEAAEQK